MHCSECIVSECIVSECIVSECIVSECVVSECIVSERIYARPCTRCGGIHACKPLPGADLLLQKESCSELKPYAFLSQNMLITSLLVFPIGTFHWPFTFL